MAKEEKHDAGIIVGLTLFVVALIGIMFWIALSTEISDGVRWLRLGELRFASLFTDRYDKIIKQLGKIPAENIKPMDLLMMSQEAGLFFRIPISIILALMAVVSFFLKEKHPYTRRFDLEGLTKEQATAFPVTAPIVKFNPLKANFRAPGSPVPERLPAFAEALSPEEWVAHNSIPVTDGVIDRDFARLAFAKQLGGRWKSVDDLPLYAQALFVAFSMKANGMRIESDEFLGEVAQCWEPGKGLKLTPKLHKQVKDKIADPKFGRITEKIAAQHSFTTPALLRCLFMAREQGGVLAPAQFVWLRAVDRHLWYALNNLGRDATHPEAAGSIAHYRAEKSAGKPIPNPQVEVGIDGIVNYLSENFITQFPAKEYARK